MKTKKKKLPDVSTEIKQLHADFWSYDFGDEECWKKLKCLPEMGRRVHWYYKDEEEFYREEFGKEKGFVIRDYAQHSGILVPRPDAERHTEEYGDYMVCMDAYPCEKENPRIDWVSLSRVLDHPEVIEVFCRQEV